ncbi:MAG: glycerate kinase [Anaerolineae bacterium]|nr:glycerate kinase [Anaerolineae bacterium]
MKIIVAPGAFKHSLTARAAAEAIARGLRRSGLAADLILLPIADGGNGTLDAFLANGGSTLTVPTRDPLGRPIQAPIGLLPDGETAVVEMALASGLELLAPDELRPLQASTFGTGLLLRAAVEQGIRRILIGMGGSATTDGGAGAVQALGVRLLDESGQPIPPGGAGLAQLARIDVSGLDPRWREIDLIIASDVTNPAIGETGAAAIFAPQKGASPADVRLLDANLRHCFEQVRHHLGVDVLTRPGGGAAGALAAGLLAFLGGRIVSGIDLLLDYNGFESHLAGADWIITGEGRLDDQTEYGKGPIGLARRAQAAGVPTIALVGSLDADDEHLHRAGLHAAFPIIPRPMPLAEALQNAAPFLEAAALRLGYLLAAR